MESTVQSPSKGQGAQEYRPVLNHDPSADECLPVILECLEAMRNGDFSVRLPVTWTNTTTSTNAISASASTVNTARATSAVFQRLM